ncbi:TIGR02302 family protein [Salinarimonas soli]|uniref:TIGR02302 family protein n=1 Tax=Salinarimonas soli TaxID=1638099 RepID=A0A5B2V843_9HYPH|nr:TIGR02302 family protein [Salinarimonas soli]KAA2234367.1 TIGR02302 family protein [Salinarimonas soli]
MTDRPSPEQPTRSPALMRLDRMVGRARLVLWWERIWPLAWGPLAVIMAFLILSWLGLWLEFGPRGRQIGLALFGLALAVSLVPLLRLRGPGRPAALDRLDRDAGLKHGPARALEDTLAAGSNDPASRALWEVHRRRAEAAVGRLRLAAPSPGMPGRDRYALRGMGILALAASAVVAGPEIARRTGSAFDWRVPLAAAPVSRIDGWVDPPLYTRTPPLMIDFANAAGEQRLRVPVKSTVVIRAAGRGDASVTPEGRLAALPKPDNQRQDLREQRFTVEGDGTLLVGTGLASSMRLTIQAIPDAPPTIAFATPPENGQRGTFTMGYVARDDYGIVSAEGIVEKGEGLVGKRSLVPAPKITLQLPADPQADAETRSTVDLSEHPWAGARVKITLVARDEAEQEGRSATLDFTLPARPFTKPLARALVEQRRNLVLDPDDRRTVQTALDSLMIAPERFTPQWGVFLGLRMATERLRRARNDESLVEVADMLWQMALQIEEGDLSQAERELRAAQERLREAMERGASEEEIRRLTEELRQAMNNFLREFAEQMQRNQQNAEQQPNQNQPERTITPDDLNRMLNQMQEAMRKGDVAEAQRLLQELQNLLNNLQAARPNNRMSDPMAREMSRQMNELDDLTRNQQQLRDETFRDGQQNRAQPRGNRQQGQQQGQRQPGQQGQRQPGQQGQEGQEQAEGQQGQQGQGQQGQQGLQQRQQALRERLEQLQRQMRGMGMQGEQGLGDAEQAMREAEGALGQGQEGQAVDAQGRALEGLQRGAQGMAQQMQQMMGEGEGNEQANGEQPGQAQPGQRGQNAQRDNDPLGRPTRSRDFSDGRVRVPTADESAVQRARRILEELRRKLGDPTRPREELDYLERLLRPR